MMDGPPFVANHRSGAPEAPALRFFCVDDHPLFRAGLIALLEQRLGLRCVGESEGEQEAWETIERVQAELALIDLRLREGDGMSLIRRVHEGRPDIQLVCLTMNEDPSVIQRAKECGADLVLIKGSAPREVCNAIGSLLALPAVGVPPSLRRNATQPTEPNLERLSPREREVLVRMGQGYTTKEIAAQLFLSSKTVETHRLRIKAKLKVNSLPELIRQAVHAANGLPDPMMHGSSATIPHLADQPAADNDSAEAPWDDAEDTERTVGARSSHPSSLGPLPASASEEPVGSFGIGPPGLQPPGRRWTGC
jgi:DNA-binding NarL/FixJ family response regulator